MKKILICLLFFSLVMIFSVSAGDLTDVSIDGTVEGVAQATLDYTYNEVNIDDGPNEVRWYYAFNADYAFDTAGFYCGNLTCGSYLSGWTGAVCKWRKNAMPYKNCTSFDVEKSIDGIGADVKSNETINVTVGDTVTFKISVDNSEITGGSLVPGAGTTSHGAAYTSDPGNTGSVYGVAGEGEGEGEGPIPEFSTTGLIAAIVIVAVVGLYLKKRKK